MANHVHNRLTIVGGKEIAEQVLQFVNSEGFSDYGSAALFDYRGKGSVPENSFHIGFDTAWSPLRPEQIDALLKRFPGLEIIYHFSEEMGNFNDREYQFVNGRLANKTEFPDWRLPDEAEAEATPEGAAFWEKLRADARLEDNVLFEKYDIALNQLG